MKIKTIKFRGKVIKERINGELVEVLLPPKTGPTWEELRASIRKRWVSKS